MLAPVDSGRVAGLHKRHAQRYGEKLEARRSYVRFLLDWRHCLRGRARQVFDLRYNDSLATSEIAARLGISPGSVTKYLKRARARILKIARRARG